MKDEAITSFAERTLKLPIKYEINKISVQIYRISSRTVKLLIVLYKSYPTFRQSMKTSTILSKVHETISCLMQKFTKPTEHFVSLRRNFMKSVPIKKSS